ncbi:MAG: glycerophosphodiester phosphodiesterase family protein [Aquirufa sp.]
MKNIYLAFFLCMNIHLSAQIPFIQGHRGCRGLYPENTIVAFEHALDLGIQVLEMDVCISKDGQVVVSHEPYMNALYASFPDGSLVTKEQQEKLNLYQMTYDEIKQFDVGKRGNALFPEQQKIACFKPLLSDVLKMAEAFRKKTGKAIYYNIEIKSDEKEYGISQPKSVEEFSQRVHEVMQNQVDSKFLILQSFDFNVLKFWHQKIQNGQYAPVKLSALVSRKSPENTLKDLGFAPDIYSSSYTALDASAVDFCHANNIQVIPWTVNEPEEMKKLIQLKVDGFITDYPNRALTISQP